MNKVLLSDQKEIAEELVTSLIQETLGTAEYNEEQVEEWSNALPQAIVQRLQEFNSRYKYCTTCILARKTNTSMHVNSTCLWTPKQDTFITIKWENAVLYCIVNIFAILI